MVLVMPMLGDKRAALILVLILCFTVVSIPQIGVVKAQESPIYIGEDGSIEPSTVPIRRNGNVYTFKNDIINYFLYIQCANIVIDGANYKLQGNGTFFRGVLVYRDNVTIKNMHISQFGSGVHLSSNNITLFRNHLTENTCGITTSKFSSHNLILENNVTNNMDKGIHLQGAGFNIIYGNEISSNGSGINIENSENNTIYGNSLENNGSNINIADAGNNLFFDNNLTSYSGNTFRFSFARNNTFHHNNFFGRIEVVDRGLVFPNWIPNSSINIWDDGAEGNYWEDYNGSDINGDGIGDNPYLIYDSNVDNYPLIEPVFIPEFPSWIILPLLMTSTLVVIVYRKKLHKTPNKQSYL